MDKTKKKSDLLYNRIHTVNIMKLLTFIVIKLIAYINSY